MKELTRQMPPALCVQAVAGDRLNQTPYWLAYRFGVTSMTSDRVPQLSQTRQTDGAASCLQAQCSCASQMSPSHGRLGALLKPGPEPRVCLQGGSLRVASTRCVP